MGRGGGSLGVSCFPLPSFPSLFWVTKLHKENEVVHVCANEFHFIILPTHGPTVKTLSYKRMLHN